MTMTAIGTIQSPFKEKFGVPRQPELVPVAEARLVMFEPYANPDAFRGIEGFSHVWLSFLFHLNGEKGWRPTVRPPRLGGNQRLGVFATRSSFRPNNMGLSLVRLLSVEVEKGCVVLRLGSCDLVHGTPILDIKPYVPYADSAGDALAGFAPSEPKPVLEVDFSEETQRVLEKVQSKWPNLKTLVQQVLATDPRPAYMNDQPERAFGVRLEDFNVVFTVCDGRALVTRIEPSIG